MKKTRDLNEKSQQKKKEQQESLDSNHNSYNCSMCKKRVSIVFLMDFIKKSGMCPDCFHS